MINKLQAIDMAMVKAIDDGKQRQITEFLNLLLRDAKLAQSARARNITMALLNHVEYRKKAGGEKI